MNWSTQLERLLDATVPPGSSIKRDIRITAQVIVSLFNLDVVLKGLDMRLEELNIRLGTLERRVAELNRRLERY